MEKIKKTNSLSEENFKRKYGEEKGKLRYAEYKRKLKYRFTEGWFIEKYGEEEGKKKYIEKNKKSAGSLVSFVQRYGEKEGKIRYKQFCEKCAVKDEIKNDPNSKYNNRGFDRTLKYWINRTNSIEEAKLKLKEKQNTSTIDRFIEKYGEEEGKKKYIETNKKKAHNKENFIRLYGEEEGKIRYKEFCEKCKYTGTLDWFIKKYGETEGTNKYEELLRKTAPFFNNGYSKISNEFIQELLNEFHKNSINFNKIYHGDNEYMFFINEKDIKIIKVDFFIKDINLVIEFYGDYWHYNPKFYGVNNISNKILKKWEFDERKNMLLKKKYDCDIIIVWERDYTSHKKETINSIIRKIKEKI
jgi:hypothetical protein